MIISDQSCVFRDVYDQSLTLTIYYSSRDSVE